MSAYKKKNKINKVTRNVLYTKGVNNRRRQLESNGESFAIIHEIYNIRDEKSNGVGRSS